MSSKPVGSWLAAASQLLERSGIATARLDCIVLLEDTLGIDRAHFLAHSELMLTEKQIRLLTKMVQRRAEHEPLAYIRHKSEFYGREFFVDHRVLEPRPESESMVDLLKTLPLPDHPTIIDIGTGSGALAITAKLELPDARVAAIDIDDSCLLVAARNAQTLHADIQLFKSDLLEAVPADLLNRAILLCNLPYVPDNFQINPAAMREPRLAIFGGPDGLDLYRRLFAALAGSDVKPAFILTEALPPQHSELNRVAADAGFVLEHVQDFIQCFKMAADSSAL